MNSLKIKKLIKFITYSIGAIAVVFLGSTLTGVVKKDKPPHIQEVYADPVQWSGDDGGDM